MRIVFFGSGSPLSVMALRALMGGHEITAVVMPERKLTSRDRLKRILGILREPLAELARTSGALLIRRGEPRGVLSRAARDADLVVVATFPKLISSDLWTASRFGGINLHQSLLPRGRGPDPLFWTYYDNDSRTGSTVHWLDEGFDSGDLLAQQEVAVERGRPIGDLYFELAEIGARQLAGAAAAIAAGRAARLRQDPALATHRPSPLKAEWRLPYDVWPAERTWHFLSGTGEMFGYLCRDPRGVPMPVGRATEFANEKHQQTPGTFERLRDRLRLFCPDGVVHVNLPRQRAARKWIFPAGNDRPNPS